jgi:hypothetical protein
VDRCHSRGFCERDTTLLWGTHDRWSGFINRTNGAQVFLDATETFRYGWPYRTLFSLPKADAQDRVSAVHDFWKSVQREGP